MESRIPFDDPLAAWDPSLVIEKQRATLDVRQGLAFFYCNRNDAEPERANPEGILRSIVRQLSISGHHSRFSKVVAEKYRERKCKHFAAGPLQLDECVDLIIKLTQQYTSTSIIIDALDECDVSTRHNLLTALSSIMQHGSSTKIFVSSRDDKDITLRLSDLPNLYIKASNNAQDIDQYVQFRVEQAVAERRLLDGKVSAATVQLIKNRLTRKAQGMFLWVTLQLQNLCSLRLNVEEDLLEELGRLPQDLANTYAQIFEHVRRLGPQSRVIAESSLKWLLCQARELSEVEFLAAISMGSERGSVNLTRETILFICGNLVMFDQELKVFRFVHLSVREYLETQPEFTLGAAHALGAEMSLLVCLHRYTELAAKHARKFRRYASFYWLYHCQEAKKSSSGGSLHQLFEDFLQIREGTNLFYAVWARFVHRLIGADDSDSDTWTMDSDDDASDGDSDHLRMDSDDDESDNWSVEVVGKNSHRRVELDHEWSDSTDDDLINGTLKEGWLGSVARRSGSRLAKRDLEEDTILDSIRGDRDYLFDPTFAACCLGLPKIVEQNLKSVFPSPATNMEEANMERRVIYPQNVRLQTYLHLACHSGSSELLRLLLQWRLFSVHSRDSWGRTALHYAANPHDVFLLKPGTSAIRVAHDQAVTAERVAMIGLLIEERSDIDAFDCNGETALHRASSANLVTEAQALLEHGAFVDSRNYNASTPLILAADLGHTAVVRLLLELKADTEAKNYSTMTPLLLAAQSGNIALAQLLLQYKADIEARDKDEETPVFKAVAKRKVDTVRLFLQLGADINAKNSLGEAPLARSLRINNKSIAQMLIEEGASIKELDRYGNTALHYAAGFLHGAMISRLLKMGARTNETNINGSTPLHVAIKPQFTRRGYSDKLFRIVQFLVDAGADVEMSDDKGRTPLHLAAQMADKASIQILLNQGANIKSEDSRGLLPLDYAALSGSLPVFSILFKRWTDVMAESSASAVEAYLHRSTKPVDKIELENLRDYEILRKWRNMSLEVLVERTTPGSRIQKFWAEYN